MVTSKANEPTAVTVEPPAIETAPSPAYQEAIAAATAATAELATAESSADWDSIADRWQSAITSLGDIQAATTTTAQRK